MRRAKPHLSAQARQLLELREQIARAGNPDLSGRAVMRDLAASIIAGGFAPAWANPRAFADWAGQQIPYRVEWDDSARVYRCAINPHDDGWTNFGRGATAQAAIEDARAEWNAYDKAN